MYPIFGEPLLIEKPLRFRPHHFLCALCFEGKGYSPSFVDNFKTIVERLQSPNGDDIPIDVVGGDDAICAPCPHRLGTRCEMQQKVKALDKAHAEILGLFPGMQVQWGEAKAKIKKAMDLVAFQKACRGCNWRSLGICERKLREFREWNL